MGLFNFFRRGKKRAQIKREVEVFDSRARSVFVLGETNESRALKVATAYACVNVISRSIAGLELAYYRKNGDVFKQYDENNINYLLKYRPMHTMNSYDWKEKIIRDVLLTGNAYIWPRRIEGEISELVLCEPGYVMHDTINDTYTITDVVNGVCGTFSEDEIIHIKGPSVDGKNGLSVISFAAMSLNICTQGDLETLNRFSSGGAVRGILTNDKRVTGFGEYQDTELEKSAKDIDQDFKDGKWIVSVPGQSELHQLSLSSVDLQFLENKKFNVREICRFFQVPPSYVYDDTSNNYKSAEMASTDFLKTTISPYLEKIENEMNSKLIPRTLVRKYSYLFDRMDIYASDLEGKAKYIASTIATGLYTVNEWRAKENRPAVDGGDKALVSANLISLDSEKLSGSVSNNAPSGNNEG